MEVTLSHKFKAMQEFATLLDVASKIDMNDNEKIKRYMILGNFERSRDLAEFFGVHPANLSEYKKRGYMPKKYMNKLEEHFGEIKHNDSVNVAQLKRAFEKVASIDFIFEAESERQVVEFLIDQAQSA